MADSNKYWHNGEVITQQKLNAMGGVLQVKFTFTMSTENGVTTTVTTGDKTYRDIIEASQRGWIVTLAGFSPSLQFLISVNVRQGGNTVEQPDGSLLQESTYSFYFLPSYISKPAFSITCPPGDDTNLDQLVSQTSTQQDIAPLS